MNLYIDKEELFWEKEVFTFGDFSNKKKQIIMRCKD